MYPLNQSVLNYFQLLFIKSKLEPHLQHSKSSTKSQRSAMISATPAGFHMSSWSGGGHTFKIKLNPADTKHFRALVFKKFNVLYCFHRNLYKFCLFVCVGESLSLGCFVSSFIAPLITTAFCPVLLDISLIPVGIFVVCGGIVWCLMRISTCLLNKSQN